MDRSAAFPVDPAEVGATVPLAEASAHPGAVLTPDPGQRRHVPAGIYAPDLSHAPVPAADPFPAAGALVAADPAPAATGPEDDWDEQVERLLRRPENLRTVYQPIVDLCTGGCVGYEALTRVAEWPARSPQPWFQAALRSGKGAQLEAAALLSALRGRAGLPADRFLTVNLGSHVLGDPTVADLLRSQPDLHGLVVELTDVVSVVGEGRHADVLAELRERGLAVAVDVAEGGLHELEQVTAVSPDMVKLERGLVKGVHADPVRERVVRTVSGLAESLSAAVLAEGIETLEDARLLQFLGIRMGQGWLFGRARPGFLPPSGEVTTWLQATWEESAMLSRVGHLAVPIGRLEDALAGGEWLAELDPEGRLRRLHEREGTAVVEATEVVRLRAGQDVRAAAARVLAAGPARRPHGLIAVADEASRFVGLVDPDVLFAEAIRSRTGQPGGRAGTEDPTRAQHHAG